MNDIEKLLDILDKQSVDNDYEIRKFAEEAMSDSDKAKAIKEFLEAVPGNPFDAGMTYEDLIWIYDEIFCGKDGSVECD